VPPDRKRGGEYAKRSQFAITRIQLSLRGQFHLAASHLNSLFPDLYKVLLEQLVAARMKTGLTQVDVAKSLKKPLSFVSKYEIGERRLEVAEFVGIARAIGADPIRMLRPT
jgi:DNA-binding transcriptional regulator YiaG